MVGAAALTRLIVLLLVGSIAVHDVRYRLTSDARAGQAFEGHGHEHVAVAGPLVATACALLLSLVLLRTARTARPARCEQLARLWPAASAALIALYVGQEVVESLLAPGHAGGLDAVVADGGWVALSASAIGGAVIALAVRVGDLAEAEAAHWLAGLRSHATMRDGGALWRPAAAPAGISQAPLARLGAGRAPPRAA